jgi:hypothetical protein
MRHDLAVRRMRPTDLPSCAAVPADDCAAWGLDRLRHERRDREKRFWVVTTPSGLVAGYAIARVSPYGISLRRLVVCPMFDYRPVASLLLDAFLAKLTPSRDLAFAVVRESNVRLCQMLAERGFSSKLIPDCPDEDRISFVLIQGQTPAQQSWVLDQVRV